jgi:hypothetical protein
VKIILTTLMKAVKREGISGTNGEATMTAFMGTPEPEQKGANG